MGTVCNQLHQLFNRLPKHNYSVDSYLIPRNGIYILFEKGESAHGTNRIVRIGTHIGRDQLRSRLKQHFINQNKDRSIFRKNIGRAILNHDHDLFLAQWELDLTTHEARERYINVVDFEKQMKLEQQVSKYIQENFEFVVFQVDEKVSRLNWEAKIISTVSLCDECRPSRNWLGNYSPIIKIQKSGLWNVNELYKEPLSNEEYYQIHKALIGA